MSVPELTIDEPLLKVMVPALGVKVPEVVNTPPTEAVFVPAVMLPLTLSPP